jgi:hypothetical protein
MIIHLAAIARSAGSYSAVRDRRYSILACKVSASFQDRPDDRSPVFSRLEAATVTWKFRRRTTTCFQLTG